MIRCRVGFSLVELLLVVVAIAILAAIVIPNFFPSDAYARVLLTR